jgi:outer membrane protein TolC
MFITVLLTFLGASLAHSAELPPDARALLNKLPGKELSLELILAKAVNSSDSYRAVQAAKHSLDAEYWQSLSALGTQFTMSATYSKNQNQYASFFEPQDQKLFVLGASTYFRTGTLLSAELNELQSTLQPGNTFLPADRTYAKVSLAQNLWRDAFGSMTRKMIESGKQMAEVSRISLEQGVQDWALTLLDAYYSAWFAKAQLDAAQSRVERQRRLLSVTRLKLNRGTAERPDFLQVESAYLQSQTASAQSMHDLQGVWRDLVSSLKLPLHWAEIPARLIPLRMDDPKEDAIALCKDTDVKKQSLERSLDRRLNKASLAVFKSSLEASKNGLNPELKLEGSYMSNGSYGELSDRTDDVFAARNPNWTVGLSLRVPLERYLERAQQARDLARFHQAEARDALSESHHETLWSNGCAGLVTLIENHKTLQSSVEKLNVRARLEEQRFRLGRSSTLAVISAGDDLSVAELELNRTTVALNKAAWEIFKLNGAVSSRLEAAVKRFGALEL